LPRVWVRQGVRLPALCCRSGRIRICRHTHSLPQIHCSAL
jgi:hypothetical protein